jgi:hypothetical protein
MHAYGTGSRHVFLASAQFGRGSPIVGCGQDRLHRVGLSLADHVGDILAGVPIVRAAA